MIESTAAIPLQAERRGKPALHSITGHWPRQCLIDGVWVGDDLDPIVDPSTGEEIARVPRCGRTETAKAIHAAKAAFDPWSARLAKERLALLRRVEPFVQWCARRIDEARPG